MGIGNLLGALGSAVGGSSNIEQVFSQMAGSVPQEGLAGALSHAFQSDQTPPFANMLGTLFSGSSDQQKAGLLNQLMSSVGPQILQSGALGNLGALLGQGGEVTPEAASQVSPEAVQQLAERAQQHNPSIVEAASAFYAQHPTVVQGLGAGALGLIMSHLSKK